MRVAHANRSLRSRVDSTLRPPSLPPSLPLHHPILRHAIPPHPSTSSIPTYAWNSRHRSSIAPGRSCSSSKCSGRQGCSLRDRCTCLGRRSRWSTAGTPRRSTSSRHPSWVSLHDTWCVVSFKILPDTLGSVCERGGYGGGGARWGCGLRVDARRLRRELPPLLPSPVPRRKRGPDDAVSLRGAPPPHPPPRLTPEKEATNGKLSLVQFQ